MTFIVLREMERRHNADTDTNTEALCFVDHMQTYNISPEELVFRQT